MLDLAGMPTWVPYPGLPGAQRHDYFEVTGGSSSRSAKFYSVSFAILLVEYEMPLHRYVMALVRCGDVH